MYQQLNIFSFLDKPTEIKTFNPIEEFTLRGSGFANGKKRIQNFFLSNNSISDRVKFLKNEYGVGGFGMPCDKPFVLHDGWSNASGCQCQYLNEDMQNVTVDISYNDLADAIQTLISDGRYESRYGE